MSAQPPPQQTDTVLIITQEPGVVRGRVAKLVPLFQPSSLQLAQIVGKFQAANWIVTALGDAVGFDAYAPETPAQEPTTCDDSPSEPSVAPS